MSKFDDIESVSRELSNVSEQRFGPEGFGLIESCLDYTSYIYTIDPELSPAQYRTSRRQLITLGRADEERMGVVYVRGPWGFFVIPQHGFPTLRVSFFHDTPSTEINDILLSICAAFEVRDADLNQGDLDE